MRTLLVSLAAFFAFVAFYLTLDCLRYGESAFEYALIIALDVLAAYGVLQCFSLLVHDIVSNQG